MILDMVGQYRIITKITIVSLFIYNGMNVYSSQLYNYIETQLTETVITSYSISEQDGLNPLLHK